MASWGYFMPPFIEELLELNPPKWPFKWVQGRGSKKRYFFWTPKMEFPGFPGLGSVEGGEVAILVFFFSLV